MDKTALLIVDVQTGLVTDTLYNKDVFIKNINLLINSAHKFNVETIYVRHDDGKDSDLEFGTAAWQIYDGIAAKHDCKIVDKQFNSAFRKTDLHQHLQAHDITNIILVGLQTEYCIDATCKVAFELGYSVIIPKGATSTVDNDTFTAKQLCEYFENCIWHNRYANVVSISNVISKIEQ